MHCKIDDITNRELARFACDPGLEAIHDSSETLLKKDLYATSRNVFFRSVSKPKSVRKQIERIYKIKLGIKDRKRKTFFHM